MCDIVLLFFLRKNDKIKEKSPDIKARAYFSKKSKTVCKPNSVEGDHLSGHIVADRL